MTDPQDEIRVWLGDELASRPRGTKGRLATYLGIRADAITRMLNSEPGKETRQIKADEHQKMIRFFEDLDREAEKDFNQPEDYSESTYSTHSDVRRVAELDFYAVAGLGGSTVEITTENERGALMGFHSYPTRSFEAMFGGLPGDRIRIATIKGDSMMTTYVPNQRVAIDLEDKSPSPPGIFFLWDGIGVVCKRIRFLEYSDPQKLMLISDNPRYEPRELLLQDVHILGRVIGAWTAT